MGAGAGEAVCAGADATRLGVWMVVDYRVELDAYSGPLDLLLLLVRRHEIDLHDIPIAQLTDQYLRHLEVIKHINVDLAGEFLVMAATLLEIKSAMLLPRPETDAAESDESAAVLDPRHELVQQLLAYRRFKDAAFELEGRREAWAERFTRRPPRGSGSDAAAELVEFDLDDVHVLDLCEAFARILESIGSGPSAHEVVYDDTPIGLHAEDIVDRLQREGSMTLQAIFVGRASRSELIGLFLATLELVRQRRVRAVQERLGGEIRLALRTDEELEAIARQEEQPVDWRDPESGEIQYEWPSEQARERAQRRAAARLQRLQQRRGQGDGEAVEEAPVVDVDGEDEEEAAEGEGGG